jgi:phage-related holin
LIKSAVVIFYCATEGLSVLENLAAVGLPVPSVLRDALKQLNRKKFIPPSN